MELKKFIELADFTEFPFEIKPTSYPHIWAGREDILKELEHFYYNVKVNGLCEFGILTGEHGSGKSHSLLHLQHLVNTKAREENILIICGYIENPCGLGTKGIFTEVYKYIISSIIGTGDLVKIFSSAKQLIDQLASSELSSLPIARQQEITGDDKKLAEWRERVYRKKLREPLIPYKLFDAFINKEEEALQWIHGISSKPVNIRGESLPPLSTHILCAKALANIINLAVLRKPDNTPNLYWAIFLLVDQLEDLTQRKPNILNDQIIGWRTLIDETKSYFGLLWAMDGSAEDIASFLTDAIERRQTINPEKLRLLPLDDAEAEKFIIEVMDSFRKPGSSLPKTYPFKPNAIKEIVNQVMPRTPSRLLKSCKEIVTRVLEKNIIRSVEDFITKDMVIEYR